MGLSRGEFLARIGLLREVDPLTTLAYRFAEQLEAELPRQGHQHDAPWHVSFHGSMFPGDNPKACARQAIYTMLDLPRGGFRRQARQWMDAGKDLELQLVRRWHQAGMLLSAPPDSPAQTQFEDPEHWLTCTVDAIIARPRSTRPVVAEVKNISADAMDQMVRLLRGPYPEHVRQIKCEVGMAHEHGPWEVTRCINSGRIAIELGMNGDKPALVCPEHGGTKCLEARVLDPVQYGFLYYVSRDDPTLTREFYFEYDPEFMRRGREQLKVWQRFWLEGILPALKLEGKNPMGWNWTTDDSPCKWCPYGSNRGNWICREDHEKSVKTGALLPLAESLAVEEAAEVRASYNLDLVRAAVAARWSFEAPEGGTSQA